MNKTTHDKNMKNPYGGKIYKRKSEALSEYNITLPEQPVPQPKDYEEIEYWWYDEGKSESTKTYYFIYFKIIFCL